MEKEMQKNPAAAVVDGSLAILSTHPATPERIARLEEKWKRVGDKGGFVKIEGK
jgi:Zn-dependent protease with chaperone function